MRSDIRAIPGAEGWFIAISVLLICTYCAGIALSISPYKAPELPKSAVAKVHKIPDRIARK